MQTTATSANNTAASTNTAAAAGSATSGSSALDQNDFLKLLVTQINNQDPTKPLDSAQFMGQLAQFATVTGIQNLQSAVDKISASAAPTHAIQAASLVGHQVLVASQQGYLDDSGTLSGAVDVPDGADSVKVSVYNAAGQQIREIDLGTQAAGLANFSWDGKNSAGDVMPAGVYSLQAEAQVAGKQVAPGLLVNATVKDVSLGGTDADSGDSAGSMTLGLQGLGQTQLSDVRRID